MSVTHVKLSFSVVVEDYERWSPERVAAADVDETTHAYDEYARRGLEAAMEAAGNAYIAANQDMFRGDLV